MKLTETNANSFHPQLPNTYNVRSTLGRVTYRCFISWSLLTCPASPPNTLLVPSSTILHFTASHQDPEYILLTCPFPHAMLPDPSLCSLRLHSTLATSPSCAEPQSLCRLTVLHHQADQLKRSMLEGFTSTG